MKKFLFLLLPVLLIASFFQVYADNIFDDVTEEDWFYSYVNQAYSFGFINGRSEKLFFPNENLTVAEALKLSDVLFINIMKLDIVLENGSDLWYSTYLEFAKDYKILDTEFENYNSPINRRDFIHIFYNAIPPQNLFEYLEYNDGDIPDVSADDPYYNEIYSFYRAGILTGKDKSHNFCPDDRILRSEVCTVLMRIFYMNSFEIEFDNAEDDGSIKPTTPPPPEYINFSLYDNYSDVILPQTDRASEDYLNQTAFIGDSLSVGLRAFKILPDSNVLAAGSIDPSHAVKDTLIMLPNTKKVTIPEACGYYLPKRVVITLGTNSVSWQKPENFIEVYLRFIDKILEYSPNTQIIIQSIPPVSENYEAKGGKITNGVINLFNTYLATLCRERNIPFLNTAEILKDERGYLNEEYQSGDGLHLNKTAYKLWIEYFMTHSAENR